MKKTYKKNRGKGRKHFRKTLKQHRKLSRKNKRKERKMKGGTGGLYAYPAQANFWEEGVSKFRSSPANLSGGSKLMPLPVDMPVSPWNNVWGKKTAIFDQK
jgi:hypothetical protein